MKFITLVIAMALQIPVLTAHEQHHTQNIVNKTYQTNNYRIKGVASAIASSQHQFYYGTKAWQGSFAAGAYDGSTAISFGIAKRFKSTLINGNISTENGKIGGGMAVNFQF